MTFPPLVGCTVVVTRAAEQAGPLVAMLQEAGAEVVEVPLIRTVPPDDGGAALRSALADLGRYAWVIVTSPNGAVAVRDHLRKRPVGHPLVAAVGPATAATLDRVVDLIPDRHLAEGLLEVFPDAPADGGRVLLPQADRARPALADGLRARGWEVDAVVAYRTVPVEPAPEVRQAVSVADALLLASGSAAESWARSFGTWTPPVVVTIGPITSAAARRLGLKVHAEATDHSLGGLVNALSAAIGAQ